MYPSRFFVATTLPDGNKKNARRNTLFGAQENKKTTLFSKKSKLATARQGVCLGRLDGFFVTKKTGIKTDPFSCLFLTDPSKKINILDNIDRSSVCLTVAVIFGPLRWWGLPNIPVKNRGGGRLVEKVGWEGFVGQVVFRELE